MNLHDILDWHYGADGDAELRKLLDGTPDVAALLSQRAGDLAEMPIHVAARRRRAGAIRVLLEYGAEIDAENGGGKSAYAHAARRGFDDVTAVLVEHGASTELAPADQFAIAVAEHRFDDARSLLDADPGIVRTGNPEEDRLLADVAGRAAAEPVEFLIGAGADLTAPGLDGGTPLHQTAWFGEPENARLLIEAGAPIDGFDPCHNSTPLHWVAHGSRYSGGAAERQDRYVAIARRLLEAGATVLYPDETERGAYWQRLLQDATPPVAKVLREHLG